MLLSCMHLGNNATLSEYYVDDLKIVPYRYAPLVFHFLQGLRGVSACRHLALSKAEAPADRYSSCTQGSSHCCNCHVNRKIRIMNNAIIFKQDN